MFGLFSNADDRAFENAQNLADTQAQDNFDRAGEVESAYTGLNNSLGGSYGNFINTMNNASQGVYSGLQDSINQYQQSTEANMDAIDRSFDRSDESQRARLMGMGFNPDASDVFLRNEAQMANERATAKEDVLNRASQNMFNAQQQGYGNLMNAYNQFGGQNLNAMNSMYGQQANNLGTGYNMSNQLIGTGQQQQMDSANAKTAYEANKKQQSWNNLMSGLSIAGSIAAAPFSGGTSLLGMGAGMLGGGAGGSTGGEMMGPPAPYYL